MPGTAGSRLSLIWGWLKLCCAQLTEGWLPVTLTAQVGMMVRLMLISPLLVPAKAVSGLRAISALSKRCLIGGFLVWSLKFKKS